MDSRWRKRKAQLARWPKATKSQKGAILDAICQLTGWHRDHAHKSVRLALTERVNGLAQKREACLRYEQAERELAHPIADRPPPRGVNSVPFIGGQMAFAVEAMGTGRATSLPCYEHAARLLPVSKKLQRRLTGREILSIAMVLTVGLWGAWHEMQVVVLLASAAGLAVLHGGWTNRAFHSALGFTNRLTSAKWKGVEVGATDSRSRAVPPIPVAGPLGILVSDLDPHAFGMLQRLRREGSLEITAASHNRAVFLQDRGLLTAEARASLTHSPRSWWPTWVWWPGSTTFWVSLSDLGSDVMTELDSGSGRVPQGAAVTGTEPQGHISGQ